MKIYSIQSWIWIWGPSLRKSEARTKYVTCSVCPISELLDVQAFPDNTVHRAVQSLVPKSYSRSLFSHPGSPGRCGSEQRGLKSCPKLRSCQHSLSWKLRCYQDCPSSSPKANAVNLGIFIFMKYLVKMCLHGGQARRWKQNTTILRYGGMDKSEFGSPNSLGSSAL